MSKTILYIPLDERPCNYDYPMQMLMDNTDVSLCVPPKDILGVKKTPADKEVIKRFIEKEIKSATHLVLSIEMVMYGGLLPSRLHHFKDEEIDEFCAWLKKLKNDNPDVEILASNLIMRTPKYSSSDEEPDYYEQYGEAIYSEAYFRDKKNRASLTVDEFALLKKLQEETPKQYIEDYAKRRAFNVRVNQMVVNLVEQNVIDYLSIPQDDSAPYGYTSIDQNIVYGFVKEKRLQHKVYIYPGADEVGCALITRAILSTNTKKVYVLFSGYQGPSIIPLYEDRPIMNSLLSHLQVCCATLAHTMEEADVVLAYNTPGLVMQEARQQQQRDVTYDSYRNMNYFVYEIEKAITQGKRVIVADSAFANGGDLEFIKMLDDRALFDKLYTYRAWNTNCNTLGTCLAHGLLDNSNMNRQYNLLYHVLDDVFYQGFIRNEITLSTLDTYGVDYFDLKDKSKIIGMIVEKQMKEMFEETFKNAFKDVLLSTCSIQFPWNRMFEIKMNIETK